MKYKLRVWGSLRKGFINHWWLLGAKNVSKTPASEVYAIGQLHMCILKIVEYLCGYKLATEESGLVVSFQPFTKRCRLYKAIKEGRL